MNFLSTHDTPRLLTLLGCEQPPADRDARAHYRLSPAERERGTALLKLAALVLLRLPRLAHGLLRRRGRHGGL